MRPFPFLSLSPVDWFQSTHPWRVRRVRVGNTVFLQIISIHAPVKGATWFWIRRLFYSTKFQSTHPWRVRRVIRRNVIKSRFISIHAPVKGATYRFISLPKSILFQSTHPWRVRLHIHEQKLVRSLFQSTHPWRVRRRLLLLLEASKKYFNPRTREGCDFGWVCCEFT